jgi:hypothetical protein
VATGKERHQYKGHEGSIDSIAFSPDGERLAAASPDAPVYVWDIWAGLPAPRQLDAKDLERCWTELAGEDAAAAFRAIRLLSAAPKVTVPFFRDRLKVVSPADAEQVRRLIKELDSPKFPIRQKAAAALEKLGDAAAHLLEQALTEASSVEVRQRLENLLRRLEAVTPEALRVIRAVEALEWAGTADGVRLLEELARGAAGARLTREAAAARARLRYPSKL